MENGVRKVEEVRSKIEEFDKTDDGFEERNGGFESVSAGTVEVEDKIDENGGDIGVSVQLDEDAFNPVEEVVSLKVMDGESASGSETMNQPVVTENNEPTDYEGPEGKLLVQDGNTSDSIGSKELSGFEGKEAFKDGFSEAKVLNLVQEVGGESIELGTDVITVGEKEEVSDEQKIYTDISRDEFTMMESEGVNAVGKVPKADILEDVHEVNKKPVDVVFESSENGVSDNVDLDETEIHEDGVNGDYVNEVRKVSYADILKDVQGDNEKPVAVIVENSGNGVSDYVDLDETEIQEEGVNGDYVNEVRKVSYADILKDVQGDNEKPVAVILENSEIGVSDNVNLDETEIQEEGVNGDYVSEVGKVSNADILENVQEVNKKPVAVIVENSENRVPDNVDLVKATIHENGVNGDHVGREIQSDGEIGVEAKGDVTEKDSLVTESEGDVSYKQKEKLATSSDNLFSVQNGSKVEPIQEREKQSFDPSSGHQDDKKVEGGSTSAIGEPDNHVERTIIPKVEKSELENKEVKLPVKKEPESIPIQKPATPSHVSNSQHDPKPNQNPIPNSKPTTALTPTPTPVPSPAPTRPAGLGRGAPLLEPAHRVVQSQPNGTTSPPQNQVIEEPTNGEADENDETREKLQMIRVKFLRLARRLGQTPHNVVVAQVLYRLGLAEQLRGSNGGRVAAFSFERASAMAEQLEAAGQEPLEFSCTIMVLGKTGVGKSATINSIFDEVKFGTDAFQNGTKKVQDVVGTVQGIKVRVIDTPGLLSSWADQRKNEKILHSVKRFIQKSPPDIVLYLDRLDMQSRDFGDMPLLRTITDIFGQSIWFNAIVVLTHAASAPPEGPNGTATSYEMFVTQRSHVVQQAIRQAAGDMRLMNPVSLVENHSACRTNRAGQRVLPNGQVWKPHLLLLSFASKILVEANMLLKLQDSPPGKPFAARSRPPPLPFILSNLLQSRPQLKLPQEQFGDDDDDDDLDELSDEESSEYDELPPFKRLTSSQLSKLSKAQKKSYYDELEYREKLFMKKQLKEEKIRRKIMKKMAEEAKNFPSDITDANNVEEDSNGAATVPVAVQDMNLPASFDADNPTHRYRALDSGNQWLTRPVLDPHGWDHDVGYEGINVEHLLALKEKIPVSFTGQITKDKKDANLQMEVSSALKHGKSNSTTAAFDMQTVGKEMSYTLRSETRFINYRRNKASAGLSATYFGDSLTGGLKFEDKLMINKRGELVVAGGAVIGRGDVAYGGSLEATLRDKDHPLGRFLSTIGLSVMDWHGDLALGWNAQSQIPIGRSTNLIGRLNLNNKGSGQVSVRLNSSEQLQIALAALVPLVSKLFGYYQDRDSAY
ncbi:hypothetical protein SSX86_015834 [Deinandra increscens subsp. villosa]|uniref:AIG1-type G domain-containing protein n=1 Tax=Deinandra increscens subsp. villosa TaxID=3103831 RepID=A0AAP0GXV0_9ASTR